MKRFLLVLGLLAILIGGGFSTSLWLFAWRPGPLAEETDHVVPRGNTDTVARDLAASGIISNRPLFLFGFRLVASLTRSAGVLHAAELHFPAHASIMGVLNVLRHAQPVSHHLTVPEGFTARQIAALLAGDSFLSGPVPSFAEGSLLPQTLSYTRNTPRFDIVERLQALMKRSLADIWAQRDPMLALSSPEQMLVLASIVERETRSATERPLVARVFLNRLAKGMKLQSDPTALYDLSDGWGLLDHPVTRGEVHRPGPHNTYEIPALPPTPICSPGLSSLEAVSHPASGDILYFVADGNGTHVFSRTLSDHNHRVDALRAARARGGLAVDKRDIR